MRKNYFQTMLLAMTMSCCLTAFADEVNMTSRIQNPSFENGTAGWTVISLSPQTNNSFTKKAGTTYLEKWVSSGGAGNASVTQKLSGLPAGNYRLTVAAQNILQSSETSAQTGVSVFAVNVDNNTTVTKADDYSVTFSTAGSIVATGTDVTVGFRAVSATGNYVCVDNFRLYYVSADLSLLQTAVSNAEAAISYAETLAGIQPKIKADFLAAIAAAKAATESSTDEELRAMAIELADKQTAARENIDVLNTLKKQANKAKTLLQKTAYKVPAAMYIAPLQTAYDEALVILGLETDDDANPVIDRLTIANDNANASSESRNNLNKSIKIAKNLLNNSETVYGKEALQSAIAAAEAIRDGETSTPQQMDQAKFDIESATLQCRIDNGSGEAPTATTVTSFIIPAAHGALIRASFSDESNIVEKGICWSKNRDPRITDYRSTDKYELNGYIFHIKDMEPASVYYARAYARTQTYAVGYGEVVKVVTLPEGGCVGTWNNGAPDEAANKRCREAIQQTMDYLNEWTAIQGFRLTGSYGASTPTADCSYGGSMRIGPNAGNQAIGTVIHETGHGVGVGQHWRWTNCSDTRENTTSGKWLGRWANKTLQFLENNYGEGTFMTGDGVHGWGNNASFDWFVNGADKDTHKPLQYIGGCALLYSLYIDGLCPTWGYPNGVPGYTYNFDDTKKYYIKCEDANRGLYDGFLYQRTSTGAAAWKVAYHTDLDDDAAWYIEYDAESGFYRFKNVESGRYLSHTSNISMIATVSPSTNQNFQLLPGRKDLIINEGSTSYTIPSFWFTWDNSGNKSMTFGALSKTTGYGNVTVTDFNFSDAGGTMQRFVILSEDELEAYEQAALPTGIRSVPAEDGEAASANTPVYSIDGRLIRTAPTNGSLQDMNVSRGIYIINGKKVVVR